MKRTLHLLLFIVFSYVYGYSVPGTIHQYPASYKACNGCSYETTGNIFYDDGGENGAVSNTYQATTFTARPGYSLSLYFTQIDIPAGAVINVYRGNNTLQQNLLGTFNGLKKQANIRGEILTIEYKPALNTKNSKGWVAHIDDMVSPSSSNLRPMSQPESDCPYAIPLCANNTVVALGGLYTDVGNIGDDDGSCYSGTGSGGSVWYSFTPQSSGPLDFRILPAGTTDYDFVLWDITAGCADGKRSEMACNFSVYTGYTGISGALCSENYGTCSSNDCSNQSKYSDCNRFNNRVNVTVGRQYAICINFYSGSNDGFTLKFQNEAGSVAITDATPPTITNAFSNNCVSASAFHVIFSEWIDCSTLQNSDFTLAGHTFTVTANNCFSNRTNNIDISVSPALPPGTYEIGRAHV